MSHPEFIAWLEGYIAGLPNGLPQTIVANTILTRAKSVKIAPSVSENTNDKTKQMLHG